MPVIRIGELEIDLLRRRAQVDARDLHLTPLELSLLYLLATNAGRLLTRDEILDYLWGGDYAAASNVVDRHVRNLRAKLRDNWRRPRYIATIPGQGYRFMVTGVDGPAAACGILQDRRWSARYALRRDDRPGTAHPRSFPLTVASSLEMEVEERPIPQDLGPVMDGGNAPTFFSSRTLLSYV
jgi:DNA-binding winged helix-turn-helix (wHTH) protein